MNNYIETLTCTAGGTLTSKIEDEVENIMVARVNLHNMLEDTVEFSEPMMNRFAHLGLSSSVRLPHLDLP